MKSKYLFILLTSIFILGACSDDKSTDASETDSGTTNKGIQEDSNDKNEESDVSKIETEDQLDLIVGDTGQFDTTLGTYEMTLDNAKLMGEELDGEKSELDNLILLDITLKNTSDSTQTIEDLMSSMEITEDLEGGGSPDIAGVFDSIEWFNGEIEAGEEKSGQLIVEVYEADEYYFRKATGNVAGGSSNQVIWTIEADDAK